MITKVKGCVHLTGSVEERMKELNLLKKAIDDCLVDPTQTICIPFDMTIDDVASLCRKTGWDEWLITFGKKIGIQTTVYWAMLAAMASLSIAVIAKRYRQKMKDSTKDEESE